MLGFNDIIQIILVSALNFCAMIINAVFIWIIRHKSPKDSSSYSILLLNIACVDFLSAFCNFMGIMRAQNVAGAAVIVYIGPCTVIHTKICHFFYAAYVELVAQSMHLLTLSFAFRLWMINSESMIHQPTISRKLWILSAFVSTWSLLNTMAMFLAGSYTRVPGISSHLTISAIYFTGRIRENWLPRMAAFSVLTTFALGGIIILVCRRRMFEGLKSLSHTRRRSHQQIYRSLTAQALLPIGYIIASTLWLLDHLNAVHSRNFQSAAFTLCSLFAIASPLINMYYIPSYRRYINSLCPVKVAPESVSVLPFCLFATSTYSYRELGAPGWSCDADLMKKSKTIPTNVHSLRPADIDIVAAIGDSLTAANGAGAEQGDALAIAIQYRGLTWSVGGDKSLDEHISVANILKKFNPNVFGYSIRTGSANVWETAHLNAGVPGAHSGDVKGQAEDLVRRMKEHPEIDYLNHWKVVHIFVGANDICSWCYRGVDEDGDHYRDNIRKGVKYMQENMPRTIVVLSGMVDMSLLRRIDRAHEFCNRVHEFECNCEGNKTVTDETLSGICHSYMDKMQEMQDSGEFDTTDDFTLIIQPYLSLADDISRNPDGTPNMDFWAPDCFHFRAYGHAIVAKNLWNNMLQPVGGKTAANLTDDGEPPLCPDTSCPFIRTTKNSDDCKLYTLS